MSSRNVGLSNICLVQDGEITVKRFYFINMFQIGFHKL